MQRLLKSVLAMAALAFASTLAAQELVKDALTSFPPGTIRLEYSNPAKLRSVPNYANLRQKFVGPRLQALEDSLAQLGVKEGDIDELMLGWTGGTSEMDLYGYAVGRFDPKGVRAKAAADGLVPTPMSGGQPAYCLEAGKATTCVLVLSESEGVFAPQSLLGSMLEARDGQAPALSSNERFAGLVNESSRSDAPIWGIATGKAVPDWFKGWMPGQGDLQLDWAKAFATVEALAYEVQVKDNVDLRVRMDCTTSQAAANLKQVMDGLKLFQQLAWQQKNPNRSNPFSALDVAAHDKRLELALVTGLDAVTP